MITNKKRVLNYLIRQYNLDANLWISKPEMERVFLKRELDGIGVGKQMMVETGNRELRHLINDNELEERKKGKTLEYRYLAKKAEYTPIYDQTPLKSPNISLQGTLEGEPMSIQELIKFWN